MRPRDLHATIVERDTPCAVVVAHDEIGLRAVDRALVGTKQQALAFATLLFEEVEDALIGVLPEVGAHRRP